MKTTTTIKALAYPVKLKDHRTGKHLEDTIVLEKSWLQICGKLDINDDKHLIYRIYNRKGFEVLEIGKRHKVELTVDLEGLYTAQLRENITDREVISEAHPDIVQEE